MAYPDVGASHAATNTYDVPSHDTFGRVSAQLDPEAFAQAFLSWTQAIRTVVMAEVIAIDGKTLRRSHDKGLGKGAIDMVSAWATTNHLILGQRKTAEKSNEITVIPELLRVLDVAGCIVTIARSSWWKPYANWGPPPP